MREFAKWAGVTIGGAILLGVVSPWGAAIQGHQVERSGHSGVLAWVDPLLTAFIAFCALGATGVIDWEDGTSAVKRLGYLLVGGISLFMFVMMVQLLWVYLFTSGDIEDSWFGEVFGRGLVAVFGPPDEL